MEHYLKFDNDGYLVKGVRQAFIHETKDGIITINESRCHSISYESIVESIKEIFNLLIDLNNDRIEIIYDEQKKDYYYWIERYLHFFYIAVHRDIISDLIKQNNINALKKLVSGEYNIYGKKILDELNKKKNKEDSLEYLNNLVSNLNNCIANLRNGDQRYNAQVSSYFDPISYIPFEKICIIDYELDCYVLYLIQKEINDISDKLDIEKYIYISHLYKLNGNYIVYSSYNNGITGKIKKLSKSEKSCVAYIDPTKGVDRDELIKSINKYYETKNDQSKEKIYENEILPYIIMYQSQSGPRVQELLPLEN